MRSRYNVGTPLYMPLEALVDNVYSPASDIFSVGIIFYELLTGTTPWECREEKQLIKKIKEEPYFLADHFKVSTSIANILKSMCAVAMEERITKEDFLNLNLTYESVNPEEKREAARKLMERKRRLEGLAKDRSLTILGANKEKTGMTARI